MVNTVWRSLVTFLGISNHAESEHIALGVLWWTTALAGLEDFSSFFFTKSSPLYPAPLMSLAPAKSAWSYVPVDLLGFDWFSYLLVWL
jgi:hypothetical protein